MKLVRLWAMLKAVDLEVCGIQGLQMPTQEGEHHIGTDNCLQQDTTATKVGKPGKTPFHFRSKCPKRWPMASQQSSLCFKVSMVLLVHKQLHFIPSFHLHLVRTPIQVTICYLALHGQEVEHSHHFLGPRGSPTQFCISKTIRIRIVMLPSFLFCCFRFRSKVKMKGMISHVFTLLTNCGASSKLSHREPQHV